MFTVKQLLRRWLPPWALNRYRQLRYGETWFDFEDRSLKEVFTHIYRQNVWGRGEDGLYSGPGSDPAVTAPYVAAVREFIRSEHIRSVVDLGCGDFRVGKQMLAPELRYHGVDIVDDVVNRNKQLFGSRDVAFSCLDATREDLPAGDLCLVREVFQHLSNEQIAKVLVRCRRFPFVIVTERVASPDRLTTPNVDIRQGPNTRADIGSGVVLDAPPFSERVSRVLVDTALPDKTVLRSVVIDNR
jgi:SAM-dependent methyltransferase